MPRYEYKVVPAPKKAAKTRGVKGTDARFALCLAEVMNQHGAEGWEYQRTDTLPCEERSGLTGRTTTFQNMLVFRREIASAAPAQPAYPTADAISSIHMAAPPPMPAETPVPARAPAARRAEAPEPPPMRVTEPAPRPVPVPDRLETPEPQPEREEVAVMPSFRSSLHKTEEPAFTSRTHEGRTPRLGAARRPDTPGKPTLVTR